ncbi:MAG: hypothetical protein ACI9BV_003949 [Rhodothermales bacterium]
MSDILANYPQRPSWLFRPGAEERRPIHGAEIVELEAAGCSAEDWSRVLVSDDFNAARVQRVHFHGDIRLGRFEGKVDRSGVPLPSGVFDATISNCRIEDDARVSGIGLMADTNVGKGALVSDCDEVLGMAGSTFGNGIRVGLQASNANRSIPVVADVLFQDLAPLVRPRPSAIVRASLDLRVAQYQDRCRSDRTIIGAGAKVTGCRRISGSYVGPGCVISGAAAVSESTLLSEADGTDGARVGGGAIVRRSLLQWNSVAEDGAFVEESLLCEASTVTRKGIVTSSVIGPNTTIAEGEVSASVVGPFVGFNHQALLVSACWPEGRGNVGYGANVGSNHTGRAPDQEVHPGEGTFFGLGINLKMPSSFAEAPYTIIATGVNTNPQRLAMPFSLIVPGHAPDAPNRLFPGWGLSRNMYGIMRNVWKFSTRNRSRRTAIEADAFRPEVMQHIERAHDMLASTEPRLAYAEHHVPGFGACVVQHKDFLAGLDAYRETLRWYALRAFVRIWDADGAPPRVQDVPYLTSFLTTSDPGMLLELYLAAERARLAAVLTSKARDDSRGAKTIEDYVQVHTAAGDDPLYLWAQEQFEQTLERVAGLQARV